MAKLFKKKEKTQVDQEEKISMGDRFWLTLRTALPAPLDAKCQPLMYIGLAFFAAAIVLVIIPSMRTMAPFALMISLLLFIFTFMRRYEMVFTGYDEYYFKTLDYTYLMKRQKDKGTPTGIMLLGVEGTEENPVKDQIYHVAVDNASSIPDIGCLLKVYVPKGAVVSNYGGKKYFSRVFAYEVEEYEYS